MGFVHIGKTIIMNMKYRSEKGDIMLQVAWNSETSFAIKLKIDYRKMIIVGKNTV